MFKKSLIAVMVLSMMLALAGCSSKKADSGKLDVMVSINPLKEFTEAIGGDKVNVESLVPEGMEPHDFEPKTKDFQKLSDSKIFIYNGLGLEDWADDVLDTIDKSKVKVVVATDGINVLNTDNIEDPHAWLSLLESKKMCENIKNSLVEADSANKDYYESRYKTYADSMQKLYDENVRKFSTLKNRDFVTSHEAFGYLCRDFSLQQKSVANLFGEGEITPKRLEELVKYIRVNKINTIFSENSASQKTSETLAKDTGAKIQKIYTLETKEDNLDYLAAMKESLDRIYQSLNSI